MWAGGAVGGGRDIQHDSSLQVLPTMRVSRALESDSLSLWKESLDATPTPVPTPLVTPASVPVVPEPTVSASASSPSLRGGSIEALIYSYDWAGATALATFQCENGYTSYGYWRPSVVSFSGDYGITQINAATWDWWLNQRGFNFWEEWMLPERNIAMAYAIYEESGGFWPWNCY